MRIDHEAQSKISRRKLLATGTTASVALAAGCVGDDSNEDEPQSDRLHVTQYVERTYNTDPLDAIRTVDQGVMHRIFDGLYEYDEGVGIIPKIAAGEPEIERDGLRYIIEIVDNAEFHNGDPVTAEDVVYSLTAPKEQQTARMGEFEMVNVDSSEAIDETTAQIDLDTPYAPFETVTLATLVASKEAREADPQAYSQNPIGSGPFKYVDHVEGEYTDLERWDDYWDEPVPEIEAVRFTSVSDDSARVSSLLAGDTDVLDVVPPSDYDTVDENASTKTDATPNLGPTRIAYNCNDGPTANPDVRAGIEHSFSMEAFIEQEFGGNAERAVAPMAGALLDEWDLPEDEYRELIGDYDPERAAELLDGNVPDGWEPRLVCLNRGQYIQLMERLALRLGELSEYGVNIDAQVIPLEPAEFDDTVHSGDPDDHSVTHVGFSPVGPDWDAAFWEYHESQRGVSDKILYDNPDFHQKIEDARRSTDRDERRRLYDELIREMNEQTLQTPGYTTYNTLGMQNYVKDLYSHADSSLRPRLTSSYNNVYIDQ